MIDLRRPTPRPGRARPSQALLGRVSGLFRCHEQRVAPHQPRLGGDLLGAIDSQIEATDSRSGSPTQGSQPRRRDRTGCTNQTSPTSWKAPAATALESWRCPATWYKTAPLRPERNRGSRQTREECFPRTRATSCSLIYAMGRAGSLDLARMSAGTPDPLPTPGGSLGHVEQRSIGVRSAGAEEGKERQPVAALVYVEVG